MRSTKIRPPTTPPTIAPTDTLFGEWSFVGNTVTIVVLTGVVVLPGVAVPGVVVLPGVGVLTAVVFLAKSWATFGLEL